MTQAAETVNTVASGAPLSMLPNPQQLEMMRGPDGELPRSAINLVRGRGRPKSARNKRSKKVADYFVAKYGDPLDVLGQMMNTPLRQMIEVLMEADGSTEREARLLEGVEEALSHIKALSNRNWTGDINTSRELAADLSDAIDKLALAASRISGKPGKLALDALALQFQVVFKALEYVHGKQPISVDIAGRVDAVIFAPELLKQFGIDPDALQRAVTERGLEAFDAEAMELLPPPEDAEFEEVAGPDDEEDGGVND